MNCQANFEQQLVNLVKQDAPIDEVDALLLEKYNYRKENQLRKCNLEEGSLAALSRLNNYQGASSSSKKNNPKSVLELNEKFKLIGHARDNENPPAVFKLSRREKISSIAGGSCTCNPSKGQLFHLGIADETLLHYTSTANSFLAYMIAHRPQLSFPVEVDDLRIYLMTLIYVGCSGQQVRNWISESKH